jgi:hypothetical protein
MRSEVWVLRLHVGREVGERAVTARADAVGDSVLDLGDLALDRAAAALYCVALHPNPLCDGPLSFQLLM